MRNPNKKVGPKIINYRSLKHFSDKTFRISLESSLSMEVYVNNDDGLENFNSTTMDTLNKIAQTKEKPVRGDQMHFMTKELPKEMMQNRPPEQFLKNNPGTA